MENIEKWRKAGRIAAEVREYCKSLVKPGAGILEVSDLADKKIYELGGEPAFPTQISCDSIAAHYCADPDDKILFESQVCSIDVGVHVDGFIGDTAATVDLSGKYSDLVRASEEALKAAIKTAAAGVKVCEIGRVIQEAISSFGFVPIRNLTGHGLSQYNIHDKPTIPNFDTGDKTVLEEGMVVAIEPFATDGSGIVVEAEQGNIFSLIQKKQVRGQFAREVMKEIEKYKTLPFTTRWLTKNISLPKASFGLRELLREDVLRCFPPLREKTKGIVTQAEKTILIGDKVEILTK